MFKKRATKKQTNIEDLLTEITTTQLVAEGQENSKEMDKGDIENAGEGKNMKINRNVNVHRNRNKMTGEEYDDISEDAVVLNDKIINDKLLEKQNGENNKTQIDQCFAEFLQGQRQNQQIQDQQAQLHEIKYNYYQQQQDQTLKNHPVQTQQHHINIQQEYQQIHRQQIQENRRMPVIHEVIIEDESGEQIEVREDYGQVSDLSDSQNYEEGYENQIIRKTLSKYNYDKVSQNLSNVNAKNKQNKLLKQLSKVSFSGIQRKIAKDLRMKKEKKTEVLNQVKYIDSKIKQRHSEISEKMKNKDKVAVDLDRIKRILQLLYYYGSEIEVEWVDEARLSEMAYEEEWKERIDRIRQNILKNKDEFDRKKNKNSLEQSQKQKSEGSQGDVEEIGKYRVGEGWNGWQVEDEEMNEKRQDQNNDDDECVQIDD